MYRDVNAFDETEALEKVDGDWIDIYDIEKSNPATIRAEHVEEIKK